MIMLNSSAVLFGADSRSNRLERPSSFLHGELSSLNPMTEISKAYVWFVSNIPGRHHCRLQVFTQSFGE